MEIDNKSPINPFPSGVQINKKVDPNNWKFTTLAVNKKATKNNMPNAYSIKEEFPKVYLQTCGNCTANAVLACDHYYYHTDKWNPSTIFTYYNQLKMAGVKPIADIGSSIETALKCVRKYGACNAKVWSNDEPYNKKPSKEAYKDGLHGVELESYYKIKSLLQCKKALVNDYPVAICMQWAFKTMDENFVLNTPTKKEAWDSDCCHAIVLVGYDDEKQLFEFRNSWGEEWGNKGYAYFTYKAIENCAFWDDTYAVVA